ncbi:acyl-coenzyme A thioesterase 1-like [Engystomops pustulosus]|uniref:acyl-coenzyme A thioesterase 1-like n=1 Tax=Engystomops pustulosus TaxID=76066 RepID=UPI003AFA987F
MDGLILEMSALSIIPYMSHPGSVPLSLISMQETFAPAVMMRPVAMSLLPRSLPHVPRSSRAMSGVRLQVVPGRCLYDAPLRLQVRGLSPGQDVSLHTALSDEGGQLFSSVGRYRADSSGELDVSRSPALEGGSYTGVEPEGPLWSLEPRTPLRRLLKKDVRSPYQLRFSLHPHPPGAPLASAAQDRSFMGEGVTRVPVRDGRVRGSLFLPPGEGPFPAIIDLYGTGGGLMEHRASLLANHGYFTMALAYFDYDDLPNNLGGLHLDYFREALELVRSHPKVNAESIGVIGISKGADLALSMATFLPGIKAAVSISGCCANTFAPLPCGNFELPCLGFSAEKVKFTEAGELDFSESMDDLMDPANHGALIPVERSPAAFLILSGSDDKNWPSATYTEQLVARLREHQKDVEFQCYPGAGHLLEPPYFPLCKVSHHKLLGVPMLWGGQTKAHSKAQEDAWKKIQTFFFKHLKGKDTVKSHL